MKEFSFLSIPKSNKAAFIIDADPKSLILTERKNRKWMKHSVALLILSPKADEVALVLPKKAAKRNANHVRVPPQQTLETTETVQNVALQLARSVTSVKVSAKDLRFLGSARGNVYRGEQQYPYGKWLHWAGVRLRERNDVFKEKSDAIEIAHWCHTNQLLSMDTYAMSERKYLMTLQALAAFSTLGVDGKITRRAKQKLAA